MLHTHAEHNALQQAQAGRKRSSKQGRKLRYEQSRMACPMCGVSSEVRHSCFPSGSMREFFYQCTNVECGCCFVFTGEISRILNPGSMPNPKVTIPLSTHVRRSMVRVMLDNAGEAAHQVLFSTPVTGDLFANVDTS